MVAALRALDPADWSRLVQRADPGAVCFASRRLELRWLRSRLGLGDGASE